MAMDTQPATKPEAQKGDGKGDEGKKPEQTKRWPLWPWLLVAIIVIGFIAVVLSIIFVPDPDVWTDDAYVTAHYATIAPRISGQVVSVDVNDNQEVRAGQVLATLDPRDFQTSVEQAEAQLARDQAEVQNSSALIDRQPSEISENSAQTDEVRAELTLAEANARRYRNLAASGAGPQEKNQEAQSTLRANQAQLAAAVSSLQASQHELDVLEAQRASAEATVLADRAALKQARLNLSYTRILAPMHGMIGEKSVQLGNYVTPGAALMVLVPLDDAYIEANYRELALRHMLPGQSVRTHVDAYDIVLNGIVNSVAPASGAVFAPVAPNNATGNFTKIVQRLAVKIVLAPNQPLAKLLRLGLSVETTVHTGLTDVVGRQRDSHARVTAN
jgi:membrane fusion protein, multidrug efflux system